MTTIGTVRTNFIQSTLAGARASDACALWGGSGTTLMTRTGSRTLAVTGATPAADGRCGGATRVERGTTNLFPNPSFEVDASGVGAASGGGAETLTRVTSDAVFGSACLQIVTTTGAAFAGVRLYSGTLTSGQAYTFSLYCKVTGGSVRLAVKNASFAVVGSLTVTPAAGWQRVSVTVTAAATETHRMYFETTSAQALTFHVDGVQAETGTVATTYADGSLGSGYAWSGTAHASTSTRTATSLTATAPGLRADAGGVALWLRPTWDSSSPTARTALEWRAAADRLLRLRFTGAGQWALDWVSGAATDTVTVAASHSAGGDVLLLADWTGGDLRVEANGVAASAARAGATPEMAGATLAIGHDVGAGSWIDAATGPLLAQDAPFTPARRLRLAALTRPPRWGE
jgi:hypothetical protein